MNRLGPAALAAVLLTSCGGPLLFAEVEVPDLRVTLPPQAFPSSGTALPTNWCDPNAPQSNPPCVTVSASYDLAAQVPAITQTGVTYELKLTDAAFILSATQSGPGAPADLGGIVSATVRVGADPAVPGSGTIVASYNRAPGAKPTVIQVAGNANIDLAPYIAAGKLPVRVEVVVDNGTPAFDANIGATFYVRITLDWGKYL